MTRVAPTSSTRLKLTMIEGLGGPWFRLFLVIMAAFTCVAYSTQRMGVRITITGSIPKGIYVVKTVNKPLSPGEVVAYCPELSAGIMLGIERGYISPGDCPGGVEEMMKPIGAVAGQHVTVTPDAVLIDGKTVPNSATIRADSKGRLLPSLDQDGEIAPGRVFMLSTWDWRGYDSRYTGTISTKNIRGVATPLFVMTGGGPVVKSTAAPPTSPGD